MKRALALLLFAVAIGFAAWSYRAPILQWGVNQTVLLLRDVGGVSAYIAANRPDYLTAEEARIDVPGAIRIRAPEELPDLRRRLVRYIWKGNSPTVRMPDEIQERPTVVTEYGLRPVSRIRSLTVDMAHGVSVSPLFIETASGPRDCLFVYHQDHNAVFLGERDWFRKILEAGCDVISVPLALTVAAGGGPVQTRVAGRDVTLRNHNDFAQLQSDDFSPIRYFVEPTVTAVNFALSEKRYLRIAAVGLSGGGWAATVVSALDERITHAYPVAGALPLFLQTPGSRNRGDWEYHAPAFYAVSNYFELYLLGVSEPHRRAIHIFNRADNCCFNGVLTAGFSAQVVGIAKRWKLGTIRFHTDETGTVHTITPAALDLILRDFLK